MKPEEKIIFNLLKKAITQQFLKGNLASSSDISKWKGQDIILFQEDLKKEVNASISEKSFYSYFKNTSDKLPRIDILNFLSQYCGYTNWNDFKSKNTPSISPSKQKPISSKWVWGILIGLGALVLMYFTVSPKDTTFSFCFIDQDRNQPITKTSINITVLNDKESPFYSKSDDAGCFTWTTKDDYIHFVIQSPYHKTDTIYRLASDIRQENLKIRTDDYALMLHYYANGKLEDWKNRRNELSQMIADDANIFQVLPQGLGIEMYSKNEFINKLTTPTQSLKNIEIIDSKRLNGQIVKLKFRIKS